MCDTLTENRITLDEIKKIECGILDYIDRICNENGLKYYLGHGTLLGAVRFNGFIPWDDDIDVYMMRDDYMKFIEITRTQNQNYKTLSLYTDEKYFYPFAKVVDVRTKLVEECIKPIDSLGVCVDIFPLDFVDNRKRNSFLLKIHKAIWSGAVRKKFKDIKSNKLKLYTKIIIFSLFKNKNPRKYALKIDKIASEISKRNDIVADISMSIKRTFHKSWFSNQIKLEFEGKKYSAPAEYDEILTMLYGNYKILPPENKRISHHDFYAIYR